MSAQLTKKLSQIIIEDYNTFLVKKGIDSQILENAANEFIPGNPKKRKIIKPQGDWKVYLITNYSDRSCAFFADFRKKHEDFKDNFIKKEGWIRVNPKLRYGFGWILPKDKMADFISELKSEDIPYLTMTCDEYEKIGSDNSKKNDTNDSIYFFKVIKGKKYVVGKNPKPGKKCTLAKALPIEKDEIETIVSLGFKVIPHEVLQKIKSEKLKKVITELLPDMSDNESSNEEISDAD